MHHQWHSDSLLRMHTKVHLLCGEFTRSCMYRAALTVRKRGCCMIHVVARSRLKLQNPDGGNRGQERGCTAVQCSLRLQYMRSRSHFDEMRDQASILQTTWSEVQGCSQWQKVKE